MMCAVNTSGECNGALLAQLQLISYSVLMFSVDGNSMECSQKTTNRSHILHLHLSNSLYWKPYWLVRVYF